jgi:hypothetical protein
MNRHVNLLDPIEHSHSKFRTAVLAPLLWFPFSGSPSPVPLLWLPFSQNWEKGLGDEGELTSTGLGFGIAAIVTESLP